MSLWLFIILITIASIGLIGSIVIFVGKKWMYPESDDSATSAFNSFLKPYISFFSVMLMFLFAFIILLIIYFYLKG